MSKPSTQPNSIQKIATLQAEHCLHPHPDRVSAGLFQHSPFFDAHDAVQVKYEMLRQPRKEGVGISSAAAQHGYTHALAPVHVALQRCRNSRALASNVWAARGAQAWLRADGIVDGPKISRSTRDSIHIGRMAAGETWDQGACAQHQPPFESGQAKKNACVLQPCPIWAQSCYEQLREQALDDRLSGRGVGLNVLLQKGMSAWLGVIGAHVPIRHPDPPAGQSDPAMSQVTTSWISALASLTQGQVYGG
jgi:hypothetical protein